MTNRLNTNKDNINSRLEDQAILIKIHRSLKLWGSKNLRRFPWRETRDPYKILVAEIMLHRTKAEQVLPIYNKFIQKYPTLKDLFGVTIEKITKEFVSLGLHWRAKRFHKLIQLIKTKYDGKIPETRTELLSLPGVGNYIASALLCYSKDKPVPVMDTNTVRVIGRVFGFQINDSSRRSKKFENTMLNIISYGDARFITFTIIDLAAAICKPKNPLCNQCPIRQFCQFYRDCKNKV